MDLDAYEIPENVPGVLDIQRRVYAGGPQVYVYFGNGYYASVVDNIHSYGVELAVMHPSEGIVYDTPVTDDVLGWLDEDSLTGALIRISTLPTR